MNLKTIKDLEDIQGKRILLRVDFNTPLTEPDENGYREVADDTRIREALPTINYLLEKEVKLIIISHLGRPKGKVVDELRLDPVARALESLLEKPVKKIDAITSDTVHKEVEEMKAGDILMLENIRFREEEENCDMQYTKELSTLGDVFVNDAFGTAHRKHASTAGLAEYIPAYAGLLMEKEIEELSKVLDNPGHPLTIIFGGAKMDSKIGVIKNFIGKADHILVAGGIGNTFLTASGHNLGESLAQHDMVELAQEIMMDCQEYKTKIILPHDLVAADDCTDDTETANVGVEDFVGDMKAFDLGKWSAEKFCNMIVDSKTVIWNGPVGVFEKKPFQEGSRTIAECIAKSDVTSIIGGGDTINAIKSFNIPADSFTHISTGGGASLEFLEGKMLPGIKPLLD
ncbi:phosphoglycerate kinase [Candidatus Peregrinibacteria bacterium]|jgi:phosphoglycerate kinase|nr:phosphoglycerate kinase [Candidatus Peregrinibacteria bacterium]MBT4148339.1 phosphoglycerate kinase [Candidatus Peregrinibacteria bacterium]MBT4366380.1 phosphoglycerate kinase [Candidatus Peregrinibacteria bacterium]MBT4455908.1 phosphoglycerate kinase [Candidatus Peregrinibacteria bacterium]